MTTQLQLRRGTTSQIATFTGAQGEVTYDTQLFRMQTHDGSTAGGHAVALVSDLSGLVTQTSLANQLANYATTAQLSNYATTAQLNAIKAVPSTGNLGQVLTSNGDGTYAFKAAPGPTVAVSNNTAVNTTFTVANTYIRLTNASAMTLQIPNNTTFAIPIGWQTTIVQGGAGQISVTLASGVTVNYTDTLTTRKQYSAFTLTKVDTNVWDLSGDMVIN